MKTTLILAMGASLTFFTMCAIFSWYEGSSMVNELLRWNQNKEIPLSEYFIHAIKSGSIFPIGMVIFFFTFLFSFLLFVKKTPVYLSGIVFSLLMIIGTIMISPLAQGTKNVAWTIIALSVLMIGAISVLIRRQTKMHKNKRCRFIRVCSACFLSIQISFTF